MTKISVDYELRKKLLFLTTPLEFCDESGRVIARYVPSTPENDPNRFVELTPDVPAEELERRRSSNERTYSTAEVIARLKAL